MKLDNNDDKALSVLDEALDRKGPSKRLRNNSKGSSAGLEKRNKKCC